MSVKRECGTEQPLAIERDQNACAQRRSRMDKRMLYGSEAAHLEQIFRGRIHLRESPGREAHGRKVFGRDIPGRKIMSAT